MKRILTILAINLLFAVAAGAQGARGDNAVERALEFIRRNASAGVHAADVIAMMGLARRSAEMRFRRATGISIQEAILAERVETAKALMRRPGLKLEAIAPPVRLEDLFRLPPPLHRCLRPSADCSG